MLLTVMEVGDVEGSRVSVGIIILAPGAETESLGRWSPPHEPLVSPAFAAGTDV